MTLSRQVLAGLAGLAFTLGLHLPAAARAERAPSTPAYQAIPPAIKARALAIDPKLGCRVTQIKPDVYVMTDGAHQSVFVTTGEGVILLDAPASFGARIVQAVAEVTKEPIKQLVYSHSHLDHIAGAPEVIKHVPGLRILAEQGNADFLREKNDPRRPLPTQTFRDSMTLRLGTATIELKKGHWHSNEGDLYIHIPAKKVLMAIDTLPPGYAPFWNFDLTTNFRAYMGMFDKLLAYDFDVLVAGHLDFVADRDDVRRARDYTVDVYETVKRIHEGTDQMAVVSKAAADHGWDNKMALFRTLLDGVADQCAQEIQGRWSGRLGSVDVYARSHCDTALIYARWDD